MKNCMTDISKHTKFLADEVLVSDDYNDGYIIEDLKNATLIFNHFLTNALWKANRKKLSQDKLEELATTTGKALHELILSTTDIDLKKV